MQFTGDENSRTYLDFDNIQDALDGIVQTYEQKLKLLNQNKTAITYDLTDLVEYLDKLADCSCLVYNDTQKIYVPHGREWIKSKVYMALKRQGK